MSLILSPHFYVEKWSKKIDWYESFILGVDIEEIHIIKDLNQAHSNYDCFKQETVKHWILAYKRSIYNVVTEITIGYKYNLYFSGSLWVTGSGWFVKFTPGF